nr:hypothetical protein [Ktedonobacteraceae bacterium]
MSQRHAAITETCGKLFHSYKYPLRSYNGATDGATPKIFSERQRAIMGKQAQRVQQ